jgi:hypothetical protein
MVAIPSDHPELAWKAYIDLELRLKQYDAARALYDRLLQKSGRHVKVYISRATFEAGIHQIKRGRDTFAEGDAYFKSVAGDEKTREQRAMLLEAWRDYELKFGDAAAIEAIAKKLPRKLKKKRPLKDAQGMASAELGFEEYFDYVFPDEETAAANLSILAKARAWKKQKTGAGAGAGAGPAAGRASAGAAALPPVDEAPAAASPPASASASASASAADAMDDVDSAPTAAAADAAPAAAAAAAAADDAQDSGGGGDSAAMTDD